MARPRSCPQLISTDHSFAVANGFASTRICARVENMACSLERGSVEEVLSWVEKVSIRCSLWFLLRIRSGGCFPRGKQSDVECFNTALISSQTQK